MIDTVATALAVGAQVVLLSTFLWAALAKARDMRGFRDTLHQLGLPDGLVSLAAPALVAAEFAIAFGLAAAPAAAWPRVLVVLLAVMFGAAGQLAVSTNRQVTCHCFGSASSALLGRRQVWLVPVWTALAAVAHLNHPTWSLDQGLAVLALVLLVLISIQLPRELRLLRILQGDRIAVAPSYRMQIQTSSQERAAA